MQLITFLRVIIFELEIQELIIFLYLYDFDNISRLILFQLGMSSSQIDAVLVNRNQSGHVRSYFVAAPKRVCIRKDRSLMARPRQAAFGLWKYARRNT